MKKIMQFIKFGIVGILNTLISEIIYIVVVCMGGHYILACFLGFSISVLNAYYWGNKYIFKCQQGEEKRVWWKVLIKTYIAYAGGFILDIVLLVLWIDILYISKCMQPIVEFCHWLGLEKVDAQLAGELIAKGINIVLIVPINFWVNKYWAYKQNE